MNRRELLHLAKLLGIGAAWPRGVPRASRQPWQERRDLFPEGVASGDPQASSVILWTRYPAGDGDGHLVLEVAEDADFRRVVITRRVTVSAASDWTCRVLVGGLRPAREYWYRFTDTQGRGSRVGRTVTCPADDDARPLRFAFVSCQNANFGSLHAYRRMVAEDRAAAPGDRLAFVLHLGDFIYEMMWYPEDRPRGYYGRPIRDLVRYPTGEKIADYHIPTTLEDYRAVYRAYLHDADLQDARAWLPFVSMWDNHEFSWQGWQSIQRFNGADRPAQTRKVAANQAWFEFQPARVAQPGGGLDTFAAPAVHDVVVTTFDTDGLGQEPGNLAAIGSLTGYRALRFGRHVEVLLTDQRSYRSEDPFADPALGPLAPRGFLGMQPEDAMKVLDAGRAFAGGHPPDTIESGSLRVPNVRRDAPPQTLLGAAQKQWFLQQLGASRATWKIWGNSLGTPDRRIDLQHLPAGLAETPWPGSGYATLNGGDWGTAYAERSEIFEYVRRRGITGFAIVSGDRHSFWAGLAASSLPPEPFDPVGLTFVVGSISAPGTAEANEATFPATHPLRPLYVADRPDGTMEPAINLLLHHGVRTCLEYHRSRDIVAARALRDPDLSPHLSFVDLAGHGYAVVTARGDALDTEFVAIARPVSAPPPGELGALVYRAAFRAALWRRGEAPRLETRVLEGNPVLSL